MKKRTWIFFGLVILTGIFVLPGTFAMADCTSPDCLDPSDWITNPDGTTVGSLSGDSSENVIINDGTVTGGVSGSGDGDYIENNGTIEGDLEGNRGADTIVNDGTVDGSILGGPSPDDITNNGTVGGDILGSSGPDTINNNGVVSGGITLGSGSDELVVNGVVHSGVYGGSGGDTIIINGTITGGVHGGPGGDTIILNGTVDSVCGSPGGDQVIVQSGATGTDINGGCWDSGCSNPDILEFDMVINDYGNYMSAVNALATELPSSGSATINGQFFTWENFDQLVNSLLFVFAPDPETFEVEEQGAGLITVYKDYMDVESGVVASINLATLPSELFTATRYENGMAGWIVEAYYVSNDYYSYHYQAWQLNLYGPDGLYSDTQMLLISHVDGSVILIDRTW